MFSFHSQISKCFQRHEKSTTIYLTMKMSKIFPYIARKDRCKHKLKPIHNKNLTFRVFLGVFCANLSV
jgi:hypothetical protein